MFKRKAVKRGSTAHAPTDVFYQFPKRPQWRKLECTPNTVNVSETGKTLSGRYEVSLAATTPFRLQLQLS